jgi:hypothetical protein
MRGRRPLPLSLSPGDRSILQEVARSRSLPFYQVQHARVVLAIAEGQRVQEVAAGMRCDTSTVWRLCRRYWTCSEVLQGIQGLCLSNHIRICWLLQVHSNGWA